MGTSTLSSIAELKMHVRNEHRLRSTKTRMKRMFATRSATTPTDELSTLSTAAQPPSPPSVSPTSNEFAVPSIDEDPNHAHPLRSGLHDIICDHNPAPTEDDEPPTYVSQGGKLSLGELFDFGNDHWVKLYEEHARRSFNEELALYDLLNEDAATGDGMEVDVDETTADILIG